MVPMTVVIIWVGGTHGPYLASLPHKVTVVRLWLGLWQMECGWSEATKLQVVGPILEPRWAVTPPSFR